MSRWLFEVRAELSATPREEQPAKSISAHVTETAATNKNTFLINPGLLLILNI
jgi:hypothetical protein